MSAPTENSNLLPSIAAASSSPSFPLSSPKSLRIAQKSFIEASSFRDELKLTLNRCLLISLQNLLEVGTAIISMLFIGHLPNSTVYLSGVGVARTLTNITGVALSWGFTTALFTLLPQSIGAGYTKHATIHVQRAFYIVTIVDLVVSVVQFFAGEIMIAIGQPRELESIVSTYCRILIPYIFLISYSTVLQRLLQALDMNTMLTIAAFFMFICCAPLTWLFVFYLDCGFYGAAIAQCVSMFIFCTTQMAWLIHKGYGYIFVPLPWRKVWTRDGIWHYLALTVPGFVQSALEWIIAEIAIILSGYVAQPTIALSTTVILNNLFLLVIAFSLGTGNASNIRVGKYIGKAQVHKAKRAARVGLYIALVITVVFVLLFYLGRDALPRLFTDNEETIALASEMMHVLVIYSIGCMLLQLCGGIYRALGLQKIAAIFVIGSYWIITLPLSLVLLFGFELRESLSYGVAIIWGSLALGNVLGCIAQSLYLVCCANWMNAVIQSKERIQHTMKEYHTVNQ